jgi:hypothetical protein
MRNFWSDPYLWIHAGGLAAVPLWLALCLLGFAVGDPWLPPGLEIGLVAIVGIAPILWMQWQRPFYIFGLLLVALKPQQLTDDQRRILSLCQTRKNPLIAGFGSVVLLVLLGKLYNLSAIASDFAPFDPSLRGLALLLVALAFLASNLFLQVPLMVLQVLLVSEPTFAATEPYPVEKISQAFMMLGLPMQKILPDLVAEFPLASAPASPPRSTASKGQGGVEADSIDNPEKS